MKYVRELEAWSVPGQLLHPEYGKLALQKEFWAESIPKDVFLGMSAIPDQTDCKKLALAIESGNLTEDSFNEFCSAYGFLGSMQSEESSARFLEYTQGRCLAWIHLPDEVESSLLPKIKEMLADRGHIVVDPESGADV